MASNRSLLYRHVQFMQRRVCFETDLTNIYCESFLQEFNGGFNEATDRMQSYADYLALENVYWTALKSMRLIEAENLHARRLIPILKYRLRLLERMGSEH